MQNRFILFVGEQYRIVRVARRQMNDFACGSKTSVKEDITLPALGDTPEAKDMSQDDSF
eukprot:m.115548 g.115548  ORF g.115548 m.115548 type:complete len:59 (+) comp17143_c0_seq2:128-304(+)